MGPDWTSTGDRRSAPVEHCDASDLMHELGRRFQTVAAVMRKHSIVPALQICTCGQVPVRTLPLFGPRCSTACERWELAQSSLRSLTKTYDQAVAEGTTAPAVGRASVPSLRREPPWAARNDGR